MIAQESLCYIPFSSNVTYKISTSFLVYTNNHDLILAKLKAYGFSTDALNLMHKYLKNRKQKVQINNKFSSERNVFAGVPQGFIDGPLLFNLFINDLVFFIQYSVLSNYADDNNLFVIVKNKEDIKS